MTKGTKEKSTKKIVNNKENDVMTLKKEIENLKKKVAEQEETIDFLVLERNEESEEVYKLRLMLADIWNIPDNPFRIREVIDRTTRLSEEQKTYNETAKEGHENQDRKDSGIRLNEGQVSYCDAGKEAETIQDTRSTEIAVDSGIDIQSLGKLIDERVAAAMDAKFEKRVESKTNDIDRNSSSEFTKIIYTNKNEINDANMVSDRRELNIIIHGVNEENEIGNDEIYMRQLFNMLEVGYSNHPNMCRLGTKNNVKPRPIKITMDDINHKEELMRNLGKLKFKERIFKRISVTEDYTVDERKEIRRWVTKANAMNDEKSEYVWKVRGTPKTGMRLICIHKEGSWDATRQD